MILAADESAACLQALTAVLSTMDVDVVAATDWDDAFRKARARRPDLLIADIGFPRLDGIRLVRKLRLDAALADVPAILWSNLHPAADVQSFASGIRNCLALDKFGDLDRLVGAIDRMLPSRQIQASFKPSR